MSVIIKSNNAGTRSLGVLDAIVRSGADLYAAYAARVSADGGEMIDAAAALDAFESGVAGGYLFAAGAAISPRWGIKKSGSDITKFYSLYGGIDAVCTGTVLYETITQAYATAAFSSSGDIITLPSYRMMRNTTWGSTAVESSTPSTVGGGVVGFSEQTGGVTALAIGAAGSGGTPGTYPINFSGGGGTGAAGTATVNGSGVISALTRTAAGKDYATTPTAVIDASSGVSGSTITVTKADVTVLGGVGSMRYNRALIQVLAGDPDFAGAAKDARGYFFDNANLKLFLIKNGIDLKQTAMPAISASLTGDVTMKQNAAFNLVEWWMLDDPTHDHMRTLTSDQEARS